MNQETISAAEIFDRLAAPFDQSELRTRRGGGGRELTYITARTARRRLNEVLGFDGWECKIQPTAEGVVCVLTIHLPDGRAITRAAMGGYRQTQEAQDRCKSADSDAFKRACVLFRVGEYLYGEELDDDVPSERERDRDRRPGPDDDRRAGRGQWGSGAQRPAVGDRRGCTPSNGQSDRRPRDGKQLWAWVKGQEEKNDDAVGLAQHLVEWAADNGFPDRCFRWSPDQVQDGYHESMRYLARERSYR
jgi:hypothetical protein